LSSDSIYVKKKSCELFTKQTEYVYTNEGFPSKIQNNAIFLVGATFCNSEAFVGAASVRNEGQDIVISVVIDYRLMCGIHFPAKTRDFPSLFQHGS
jgi:hypothetical protein